VLSSIKLLAAVNFFKEFDLKLEGLTVLDLSLFLPGPAVSQMMSDHGARIIKIENPAAPEPTRFREFFPWVQGGSTVMFRTTQRGKESLALNLKSDEGRDILLKLATEADVFIESFRPGVMKRLGIDYKVISRTNSKIVYCSLSAFGQNGPWKDRPAHDTAAVAASGVLSVTRSPSDDSGPAIVGVAMSDILSAHLAFGGIMMALYRRHSTGVGDYIDISMFESVLNASPNIVGPVFAGGKAPERFEERTHGGNAMLNIYELKDGAYIALGGGERKFVIELFAGLERPDFVDAVTGPAGDGHREAIAFLRKEFLLRTRAEWEEWFEGRDIGWMPVMDLAEAWNTKQVWERGMRVKDDHGNDHIGIPIKFLNEPGKVHFDLPSIGQHTSSILENLGFEEHEIKKLAKSGVVALKKKD